MVYPRRICNLRIANIGGRLPLDLPGPEHADASSPSRNPLCRCANNPRAALARSSLGRLAGGVDAFGNLRRGHRRCRSALGSRRKHDVSQAGRIFVESTRYPQGFLIRHTNSPYGIETKSQKKPNQNITKCRGKGK